MNNLSKYEKCQKKNVTNKYLLTLLNGELAQSDHPVRRKGLKHAEILGYYYKYGHYTEMAKSDHILDVLSWLGDQNKCLETQV
jgi:hypothetical protein